MSMSMSGGPSRSGDRNRSNKRPEPHRVGVGDPEREADRRVGGRAAALAVDVVAPAELHDVPHDEEVAGEPERLDHLELVVELGPGPGHPLGRPGPVALRRPLLDQRDEVAHLVEAVRGPGRAAAPGRADRGRRRAPRRARRRARPRRGSGRTGGPARRPSAGARPGRPAASRPSRRGTAAPAPPPARPASRWPEGVA